MSPRLHRTVVESPVGPLVLVASTVGLRAVLWGDEPRDRVRSALPAGAVLENGAGQPVLADTAEQLSEYFSGRRTDFDLPLDPCGTSFQQSAWEVLRGIPFGATVTYAEQARRLGDQRKARAVGAANARNPISIVVPCHRVVGSNGALTGFAGGTEAKAWLLAHEQRVLSGG